MIAALLILALQAAPAAPASPPAEPSPEAAAGSATVAPVTVTGGARPKALPEWSHAVEPRGWPFMGVSADRSVLMFAKTAPAAAETAVPLAPAAAGVQRVWVRHEFHDDQRETGLSIPTQPYRSERLVQDVDCGRRAFRSLVVVRYPKANLEGRPEAFDFAGAGWTEPAAGSFDETVVEAACTFPRDVAALPGS